MAKQSRQEKEGQAGNVTFSNFIGEMKAEIGRITWPETSELFSYSKIVVAATFIFGIFIYLMDVLIRNALDTITFLLSRITG